MLTLHHLNNSRSQRILWLLEELGVPYEIRKYARDPVTLRAPADLRRIHPLGKSPVVTDGAVTVAESGAIIEYLIDTHAQGRMIPPAGTEARRRYTYWLHFAEGSAMPFLLMKLVFNRVESADMPFFVRPVVRKVSAHVKSSFIDPELRQQLDYMEAELAATGWFAGNEFTAADIQMSFPLEAAAARGGLDAKYPNLARFLERIHARPAYQRALEKGGEFGIVG
ncbi:MAG: glutathione S-transferase [Betaproteobacteria bacterium]|nr:glutathione S-transferase [Betaproteobacteria bacterium]